jgi:type II secretory pathway pseudopilin PulG/tetratricopeptide (TPR) repeat protein
LFTFATVLLLLAIMAIMAAMLMPALAKARAEAPKTVSKGNLHAIGMAITLYRNDHNDEYPPSLEALYPNYADSTEMFENPRTGGAYVYISPKELPFADQMTPMAWEDDLGPGGGANVLYMDTSVRWVDCNGLSPLVAGYEEYHGKGTWPGGDVNKLLLRTYRPLLETGLSSFGMTTIPLPRIGRAEDQTMAGGPGGEPVAPQQQIGVGQPAAPAAGPVAGGTPGQSVFAYVQDNEGKKFGSSTRKMGGQAVEVDARRQQQYQQTMQVAESYRRQGDLNGAARNYERAIQLQPESKEAKDAYDRLKKVEGKAVANASPRSMPKGMPAAPPAAGIAMPSAVDAGGGALGAVAGTTGGGKTTSAQDRAKLARFREAVKKFKQDKEKVLSLTKQLAEKPARENAEANKKDLDKLIADLRREEEGLDKDAEDLNANNLAAMDKGMGWETGDDLLAMPAKPQAPPPPPRVGVGGILTVKQGLAREAADGWQNDVARTPLEQDVLALVARQKDKISLPKGGEAVLDGTDVVVRGGSRDDAEELQHAASEVFGRMVAQSREITARKQQAQAALDVQRRAEADRRASIVKVQAKARAAAGTVSGSRGTGAMPIEIAFPSFGTTAYPFRMDFAGTSQPRIEMTCLRTGTATVLQGLVVLAVCALVSVVSWRRAGAGLVLGAALALVLTIALRTSGEASKQYVVMALAGVCLAAPVVLARLAALAWRWRKGAAKLEA